MHIPRFQAIIWDISKKSLSIFGQIVHIFLMRATISVKSKFKG